MKGVGEWDGMWCGMGSLFDQELSTFLYYSPLPGLPYLAWYSSTTVSFSCGPQIFLTEGNPWLQAILKSLLNRINLINFFFTKQKARTTCYTCTCYFLFPISFLIIDIILFMRFSRVQSQSRRSLDGTSQRPCPNSLEQ